MTDYELLTATDAASLSILVMNALADGYTLHGSTGSTVRPCGTTVFYQAVCK